MKTNSLVDYIQKSCKRIGYYVEYIPLHSKSLRINSANNTINIVVKRDTCYRSIHSKGENIMPTGKRIYTKRDLPDPAIVAGFAEIPTANTCDVMNRNSAMHPRIHQMAAGKAPIVAGPALTVKCRAGDNLALHAALELCEEGDVVVVSNEGDETRSLIGDNMMAYLYFYKKAAALIVDGAIRDVKEIQDWGFPVYATGSTPGGPYKEGPGEVNVPISCGNISVRPGDIVVCDTDGIIVIPRKDAEELLPKAQAFKEMDQAKLPKNMDGTANRAWVQKSLAEKGFDVIDAVCEN